MTTTRHIYNSSGGVWTFFTYSDPGYDMGNVWFSGDGTGESQNGPWVLQPGQTATIDYTTTDGMSKGAWKITDAEGCNSNWYYDTKNSGFPLPVYDSPKILHDGDTGAANLNDPSDGDITMVGNTWN